MDTGLSRAFADLHCHSAASFDSLSSVEDLVRSAARHGLTHLAITDHESIDGALRARDIVEPGLTVIVGEEIRTTGGDLIGLYLERAVPAGMSAAATSAAIREQGGLVGLPHPFDRFRSSGGSRAIDQLAELAGLIDYVEIYNARAMGGANTRAADFARDHGLPGVAASDAHTVMEVGVAYTLLTGPLSTAVEMRTALAAARIVTGRGSFVARAWTPLAKVVQRSRGNGRQVVAG